jgi:hypothetical protein
VTIRSDLHALWHDDFSAGFSTSGPDARWTYIGFGPHVADDGTVRTSERGLEVVSGGTNPATGEPAFQRTLAPEGVNPHGLPGLLDHLKWFAFADHAASTGFPGFDAVPGQVLSGSAWLSGRTYGTHGHPFGDAVADPDADLRLATVTFNAVDPETSTVFNLFLTNTRIYAFYERLPNQRAELGPYAAFSYAIPVAERSPDERHHLEIAYDRSAGTVRWLVDGREVFRVTDIGAPLDSRRYLLLDHGGPARRTEPRQLRFGIGMLTLLDARLDGRPALVRLVRSDGFYVDPVPRADGNGGEAPPAFLDEKSREPSRLFGQGAALSVSRFVVSSAPAEEGS